MTADFELAINLPFTLTTHRAVLEKKLPAAAVNVDVVSKVGSWIIVRESQPFNITPAVDPRKDPDAFDEVTWILDPNIATGECADATRLIFKCIETLEAANKSQLLASIAARALSALSFKACNSGGEALWAFASLTRSAAEALSQIATARPKVLIPVARQFLRWPLMMSRHQGICDKTDTLRAIKLGSGNIVRSDELSKWKADAAQGIALGLLSYIRRAWEHNQRCVSHRAKLKPIQEILPPFEKRSARKWWVFASRELIRSYPEPHCVPELRALSTARSRQKSAGRIKAEILAKIKARFVSLAQA